VYLSEYRTNSKLAKYFWWNDGGHESIVINHEFNGHTEYRIDWHGSTNKPWLVLFTRRRNWLLHIEWKLVANHLCVLKNRCIGCAVFRWKGPLAQGVAIGNGENAR
jgi:hypothetical protein